MNFKIEPIQDEIISEVRRTMASPQYSGLTAFASVADGYGPCRSCLKVFSQGVDRRIYFTYNPFDGLSSLPDPGPVFIHEVECQKFEGDFPRDILDLPVYLEAYGGCSDLVRRERMDRNTVAGQIETLLKLPAVQFVNLRNAEAGCFIARAVREQGLNGPEPAI